MYEQPCSLADLLALPDMKGFPPLERRRLYMAYLRWQLTRPGGVASGNANDKKRALWKEKRAQGHLSPGGERVLAFVAQHGIVITTRITTELDLARGTLQHQQSQLVDGGYAEYQPGGPHHAGTLRITRKGLERAGMDPDTSVPMDVPAAPALAIVSDDGSVASHAAAVRGRYSKYKRTKPGRLSASTERVLLYVAKLGIVTTTQAAEQLGIHKTTLQYHKDRLGDYVEYRSGGAHRPGTLKVTLKGLAKAGMNPDHNRAGRVDEGEMREASA